MHTFFEDGRKDGALSALLFPSKGKWASHAAARVSISYHLAGTLRLHVAIETITPWHKTFSFPKCGAMGRERESFPSCKEKNQDPETSTCWGKSFNASFFFCFNFSAKDF
ncbi:hypothetical protein TWF225_006402 [Orbilia oligospora]|nr:hypothetical protein TWF225_006402 [Orbilia oligospora]KAF3257371.1 hypothetical protein TWF217_006111 [Orbilia oligospora]KAF3258430.1 hypothetical protein TWF128_004678 [Orbilia oligospora]KAF3282090.1 hypothetical protein TWF132_010793 [Orbilia oligospora]